MNQLWCIIVLNVHTPAIQNSPTATCPKLSDCHCAMAMRIAKST